MLYHIEAFSWWWLGSLEKTLYHLGRILPWCQQHSLISLDFCWHQLRFLSIWCSIKTFGYVFAVGIIFIWGCFDTALWSPAPSYRWHPSYFSLFWYSNTRSDENRRRFFVCLHGAGPICKQIKDVYRGGQANEKRRLRWASPWKWSRLQNRPGWTDTYISRGTPLPARIHGVNTSHKI